MVTRFRNPETLATPVELRMNQYHIYEAIGRGKYSVTIFGLVHSF